MIVRKVRMSRTSTEQKVNTAAPKSTTIDRRPKFMSTSPNILHPY